MFYKSILNVVAVVAAVMAVMLVGCVDNGVDNNNRNNGGNGNGLEGDWSYAEEWHPEDNGGWRVYRASDYDDSKLIFSFKSSGEVSASYLNKIGDFWIESVWGPGIYSVKDNIVCFADEVLDDVTGCWKYSISGDNLTLSDSEHGWEVTIKAVRTNLANAKRSIGGRVYTQDPALMESVWEWTSGYEEIRFGMGDFDGAGYYYGYRYISRDYYEDVVWYTEGSHLTILGLGCARYETGMQGTEWEYEYCVSYFVAETVTLDYQLASNGRTLRLRPAGSTEWDVWTRGRYKSREEKPSRAVSPFWAFRQ